MLNLAVVMMTGLMAICVILYLRKVEIVPLIFLTIIFETSMYIIVSGVLFWADIFSIQKAVLGVIIVQGILICILFFKNKEEVKITYSWKGYIIPIVIVLITLPLVWQKYGFYGMGQDEGVYQNHAILLMYGKNDVQLDFEEYDQLADDQKDYYKQELHEALTGYYFYDTSLQTANEENKISEVSGTIHGIPTFAAILALCGRVFGLTHMVDIQTIYFVCAVFLIYMLAKDLRMKKGVTILLTTVTAISPIILWTAKSSLTEVFLIILMELYIYGIVNYQDKKKCWFAVVAIVTFSFYHFTIYTMLPMFILIYWGLFIAKGEKKIIYQCVTVVLGALLGICMSCFVAPAYTIGGVIDGRRTGNFKPLYDLIPWINESNVLTVTCI
ncbi:MAG TPA: hypothetical protein IAB63_05985, partial [Candidatus Onthocola gallistercoris]|nr:hypothetical protein [Candidatus Onthocola gallistercoris]